MSKAIKVEEDPSQLCAMSEAIKVEEDPWQLGAINGTIKVEEDPSQHSKALIPSEAVKSEATAGATPQHGNTPHIPISKVICKLRRRYEEPQRPKFVPCDKAFVEATLDFEYDPSYNVPTQGFDPSNPSTVPPPQIFAATMAAVSNMRAGMKGALWDNKLNEADGSLGPVIRTALITTLGSDLTENDPGHDSALIRFNYKNVLHNYRAYEYVTVWGTETGDPNQDFAFDPRTNRLMVHGVPVAPKTTDTGASFSFAPYSYGQTSARIPWDANLRWSRYWDED